MESIEQQSTINEDLYRLAVYIILFSLTLRGSATVDFNNKNNSERYSLQVIFSTVILFFGPAFFDCMKYISKPRELCANLIAMPNRFYEVILEIYGRTGDLCLKAKRTCCYESPSDLSENLLSVDDLSDAESDKPDVKGDKLFPALICATSLWYLIGVWNFSEKLCDKNDIVFCPIVADKLSNAYTGNHNMLSLFSSNDLGLLTQIYLSLNWYVIIHIVYIILILSTFCEIIFNHKDNASNVKIQNIKKLTHLLFKYMSENSSQKLFNILAMLGFCGWTLYRITQLFFTHLINVPLVVSDLNMFNNKDINIKEFFHLIEGNQSSVFILKNNTWVRAGNSTDLPPQSLMENINPEILDYITGYFNKSGFVDRSIDSITVYPYFLSEMTSVYFSNLDTSIYSDNFYMNFIRYTGSNATAVSFGFIFQNAFSRSHLENIYNFILSMYRIEFSFYNMCFLLVFFNIFLFSFNACKNIIFYHEGPMVQYKLYSIEDCSVSLRSMLKLRFFLMITGFLIFCFMPGILPDASLSGVVKCWGDFISKLFPGFFLNNYDFSEESLQCVTGLGVVSALSYGIFFSMCLTFMSVEYVMSLVKNIKRNSTTVSSVVSSCFSTLYNNICCCCEPGNDNAMV